MTTSLNDQGIKNVRLFKSWKLDEFQEVNQFLVLPEIVDAVDWIESTLVCDMEELIDDTMIDCGNITVEECLIRAGISTQVFEGELDCVSLSAYLQTHFIRCSLSTKITAEREADECFDFAARKDIILGGSHQLFSEMEMAKINLRATESPLEIKVKGEEYTLRFNVKEKGDIYLVENVSGKEIAHVASKRNVAQGSGLEILGWVEPETLRKMTKAVRSMAMQ